MKQLNYLQSSSLVSSVSLACTQLVQNSIVELTNSSKDIRSNEENIKQ